MKRPAWTLFACAVLAVLAGCASGPRGGDGAEANAPANLDRVPDAEPRVEAIRASGGTSKPYAVLGQSYVPIIDDRPFRERGLASWYGRKFNSGSTASGEPYDMYAMTAAHKTLPLPSYVRVRNPANGREVIVRVNDRGPFHEGRIIDLSYTAALKLDLLRGVAPVEIERITNEDIRTGAWRRAGTTAVAQAASAPPTPPSLRPPPPPPPPLQPSQPTATQVASAPQPPAAVAVPIAMTSPVVDQPRAAVVDLPPMSATALPSQPTQASPRPVDTAAPATGFWVQLGAFSQRDGAASFQEKVARQMPALKLTVFSENGIHRLQAGPYASRESALAAGEQVRNGLGLAPVVVERR